MTPEGDERPTGDVASAAPTIGAVRPVPAPRLHPPAAADVHNVTLDSWTIGNDRVAAASVSGLAHLASGTRRQDAYALGATPTGALVLAIADGLGSREHAHLGARLFCEAVVRAAAEGTPVDADPTELLALAVRRAARVAANVGGHAAGEIACVAGVGVVGDGTFRIARVGDVTAFVLDDDGFRELFHSDDGPVNVTGASVPPLEPASVEMISTPARGALVAVTDGVAVDLRSSPQLRTWLHEKWRAPITEFAMGDALRYRRQGSHDDRTAIVVWPGTSGPRAGELPSGEERPNSPDIYPPAPGPSAPVQRDNYEWNEPPDAVDDEGVELVVVLRHPVDVVATVLTIEDNLAGHLTREGAGEVDGNEIGDSAICIFCYGTSSTELKRSIDVFIGDHLDGDPRVASAVVRSAY